MATEPDDFSISPEDLASFTLKCTRCGNSVAPHRSIGESLIHAPLAMLHHWDMIQLNEDMNVNEMNSMPLLFTSYESYIGSTKSFQKACISMSGDEYEELLLKTCTNHSRSTWHRFCEAVKVDMANSKEKSFNDILLSTLSLINV
jgi:hypothetical protein